MDEMRAIADRAGFFSRREALAMGYDDRELGRSVRADVLVRPRRGMYAYAAAWRALDDVGRHRVLSRAVLSALGDAVCLSHVSAAVAHGVDLWGQSLDRVHVTRLDGGAGRVEGDVVHHEGLVLDDELVVIDDLRSTPPARAALETASAGSPEQALALFDSFLRDGLITSERLRQEFERMSHWPRVRRLHVPLRLADGKAGSVGESRGLWCFWKQGLPVPESQYPVHDADGTLIGICDWAWPDHRLLGEFDGRVKYGRLLRPGQEPGDVVFAEKQREDRLREATSMGMIRLIWSDLDRPQLVERRVRALMKVAT